MQTKVVACHVPASPLHASLLDLYYPVDPGSWAQEVRFSRGESIERFGESFESFIRELALMSAIAAMNTLGMKGSGPLSKVALDGRSCRVYELGFQRFVANTKRPVHVTFMAAEGEKDDSRGLPPGRVYTMSGTHPNPLMIKVSSDPIDGTTPSVEDLPLGTVFMAYAFGNPDPYIISDLVSVFLQMTPVWIRPLPTPLDPSPFAIGKNARAIATQVMEDHPTDETIDGFMANSFSIAAMNRPYQNKHIVDQLVGSGVTALQDVTFISAKDGSLDIDWRAKSSTGEAIWTANGNNGYTHHTNRFTFVGDGNVGFVFSDYHFIIGNSGGTESRQMPPASNNATAIIFPKEVRDIAVIEQLGSAESSQKLALLQHYFPQSVIEDFMEKNPSLSLVELAEQTIGAQPYAQLAPGAWNVVTMSAVTNLDIANGPHIKGMKGVQIDPKTEEVIVETAVAFGYRGGEVNVSIITDRFKLKTAAMHDLFSKEPTYSEMDDFVMTAKDMVCIYLRCGLLDKAVNLITRTNLLIASVIPNASTKTAYEGMVAMGLSFEGIQKSIRDLGNQWKKGDKNLSSLEVVEGDIKKFVSLWGYALQGHQYLEDCQNYLTQLRQEKAALAKGVKK